jgi:20S proteasome subunit alpha 5
MGVEPCTQSICDLALRFGEDRKGRQKEEQMSRPFGVALLIAGIDENGPVLYHTDPSGTFTQFDAKAIGAGSEGANTTLQEKYNKSMTFEEAETLAVSILKQVMEEKITSTNIEIAAITTKKSFHIYSEIELQAILNRISS